MKKVLLSAAVLFMGYAAQAQETVRTVGFQQGDVIVEGNIGFGFENDRNTEMKTNSFNFNPKAGLLVTDRLAVGVEFAYNNVKNTQPVDQELVQNSIGAGVFGRYYFLDLGAHFNIYSELGVGFNTAKTKTNGVDGLKNNGFGAGLGLGFNYFLTPSVAINFGLTDILSYQSSKVENQEAVSSFRGNFNVFENFFSTAQFGLTYRF